MIHAELVISSNFNNLTFARKHEKDAGQSIDVLSFLDREKSTRFTFEGRGFESLVLGFGDKVVKFKLRGGLSTAEADRVAMIAYPGQHEIHERVSQKLSDSFKDEDIYQRQVYAHKLAGKVVPHLVDLDLTLLTTTSSSDRGRVVGIVMPKYRGRFLSLSDPEFGLTHLEKTLLREKGVVVDDFSRRRNGVILETGERRIFDISVSRSHKMEEALH